MEFSNPSVMSSSGAIRVSRFTLLLAACTVLAALILTGIFVHEFTKAGDAAGASSSSAAAAGGAASAGTSGAAAATEASSAARPRRTLADVLLPNHLRPTVYRVELQPFLEPGNFVTRGSVSIDFECLRDANNVTVHARNLSVVTETVRVVGVGGGRDAGVALKVVGQTYHPGSEFYTVHLDPGSGSGFALVRGSNYTVSMDFAGFLHDNLVGFYRSSYTYNNETK
ncbi:unnamed protein product [Notodromas monacha]|uniref:Aminopeptidase N-like N-terminal domain-containing protein n=1 Tax=Notodromas monacha TaxID=399045 RepID=A0A7R9GE80_9CRUS|nr:unnamed protein product [Notodromas monacha]CAG0917764.1 unnamed protein product [Notodromas monacha]